MHAWSVVRGIDVVALAGIGLVCLVSGKMEASFPASRLRSDGRRGEINRKTNESPVSWGL